VQLKRRYDLIPNPVETCRRYAAHEKGTFENIAEVSLDGHAPHRPG
jgi:LemA protein